MRTGPADHGAMDPIEIATSAARHHQVLGPALRSELGVSASTWGRWLRRDGVERPYRGVGLLPGVDDRGLARVRAAIAAVSTETLVTGWTAARLLGLVGAHPSDVHLLTRHGASIVRRSGLRVTETSVWPRRTERVHDVGIVPAGRMLADLSAEVEPGVLRDLAIDARFAGLLRPGELDHEAADRRRFPGRRVMRGVASELRADDSDSGFELAARARMAAVGLPPDPEQAYVVVAGRRRRIDLPYRSRRVGVECLGLAAHSGRRAFDGDAARRNDFAEDGAWLILELTWTTFHRDWDEFEVRLRRVLASRS